MHSLIYPKHDFYGGRSDDDDQEPLVDGPVERRTSWSGTASLIKAIRKPTITCKYCGLAGFRWKQTDQGQWRLHEVDKLHECASYVAKNGK